MLYKFFEKSLLTALLYILIIGGLNAQTNSGDNGAAYPTLNTYYIKYAEYSEERIWLNNEKNKTLFYSTDTAQNNTANIVNVAFKAIFENKICAYEPYTDFELLIKADTPEIKKKLGEKTTQVLIENPETGEFEEKTININYDLAQITSILVSKIKYFDKKNKLIYEQIIGFIPIRQFTRLDEETNGIELFSKICYINFEEIAPILKQNKAGEKNNLTQKTLFDILINKNYFAEENTDFSEITDQEIPDNIYSKKIFINIEKNPFRLKNIVVNDKISKTKPEKQKNSARQKL